MAPTLQKLSDEVLVKIMGNHVLVGRLMALFNVSQKTIYRWAEANEPKLTNKAVVQIMAEETGLTEEEILTA